MLVNTLSILAALLFIALAGFFAGAETGLYRLSRLRLRLGIEKRKFSSIMLAGAIHDSPGLLLSLLVGTNLAEYFAASIVTALFLSNVGTEHTAEFFATLVTAPTAFVFSELIPKNLFYYRADLLMPYCGPPLLAFHRLFTFCGVVPLLRLISRFFARLAGSHVPSRTLISAAQRHHVRVILADVREEGILSPVQANMIDRLVNISNVRIRSVMTPVGKTLMVNVKSDNQMLLSKLSQSVFTRLLVYEDRLANVTGFVNIYDTLASPGAFSSLRQFVKPILKLDADTAVIDAINSLRDENQKIALVVRAGHTGRQRPIGIVTMKDLVEELFGELGEW